MSPDGNYIVGVGDGGILWNIKTYDEPIKFKGHTHLIQSVAFSPDGKRIVTGSIDKTVRIWDTATGKELLTLTGHTGSVLSVAFSQDGKKILSGGSDGRVILWRKMNDTQLGNIARQD